MQEYFIDGLDEWPLDDLGDLLETQNITLGDVSLLSGTVQFQNLYCLEADRITCRSPATFVAAATFEGSRPGFTFKKGPQGLGYYKDLIGQYLSIRGRIAEHTLHDDDGHCSDDGDEGNNSDVESDGDDQSYVGSDHHFGGNWSDDDSMQHDDWD